MRFLFLSFLIFFATKAFTQNNYSNNDTIIWNSSYKLKWDDFQGKIDSTSDGAAATNSGIKLKYRIYENKFSYTTYAFFLKKLSWKKTNINDEALRHEQAHFDITEIFYRKLDDTLKKIATKKVVTEEQVDAIYDFIYMEFDKFQDLYDLETDFGRIPSKQKYWETKIQKELLKSKKASIKKH